jgi:hypothetical protein
MLLIQLIKLKFIFRASDFHYFNIFSSGHNSIWVLSIFYTAHEPNIKFVG